MGLSYWPESNLRSLLETIIQNYEEDREKYWSDDNQTKKLREFIDAVATSFVSSSNDLVLTLSEQLGPLDWETANTVIEQLELSREVHAKAEILLAWQFATSTDEMADRCVQLAKLVLKQHPSERVLRFMRRLGRCYVAGFFPEAIMVCRSVLESAVDEAIARHVLESDGKMKSKLNALEDTGHLSNQGRADAWLIWLRGNAAIHKDPEAVGQVPETIAITLRTLAELQ